MTEVNLLALDFNLLKLLSALLRERHVTRAGESLGLSQPAASRGLARLRHVLGDKILVRDQGAWTLTARAESLIDPLERLMETARSILTPPAFDPATARGTMTIASHDYQNFLVLPPLMALLRERAPLINIAVRPLMADLLPITPPEGADVGLGVFHTLPGGFRQRALYRDGFACVLRRGHPAAKDLTIERYAALDHIQVNLSGREGGPVDELLEQRGVRRRIAVRVPHFLVAPMIVANSDLILTLPHRLAVRFAALADLELVAPPVEIDAFTIFMVWHERRHDDPAHIWLRAMIVEAAKRMDIRPDQDH